MGQAFYFRKHFTVIFWFHGLQYSPTQPHAALNIFSKDFPIGTSIIKKNIFHFAQIDAACA